VRRTQNISRFVYKAFYGLYKEEGRKSTPHRPFCFYSLPPISTVFSSHLTDIEDILSNWCVPSRC
jgi:hypothetical protein